MPTCIKDKKYMQNFKKLLKLLIQVNWIKTFYFNFHYLKIKQAIYFPILIFRNTILTSMKGNVFVDASVKWGGVRIGQYCVGTLDMKFDRTLWQNNGTVIFHGKAHIGSGTKCSVNNSAYTFSNL